MVFALVGTNWYGIKHAIDERIAIFMADHDSLGVERMDASEVLWSDVLSAVSGLSLFAEDKLIILYGASQNKELVGRIDDLLEAVPDTTELLLVDTVIDKRSAYYKRLKKLEHFQEFEDPSAQKLASWATAYTKKLHGHISHNDAVYLIERAGNNQTLIERELTKLVLYDPEISRKHIDLLVEATPSSTVFQLVESAFGGNTKRALALYDEQRQLKKEPQAILGMLVWQMHLVAICAAAGDKNLRDVANETGLNHYSLSKAQTIARRMGVQKIKAFLQQLRDIEYASKHYAYNIDEGLKTAIVALGR